MKAQPRKSLITSAAVLAALVLLIICERLVTYGKPLETDVMIYAVFGREMLEGRSLYTDLWDHKPPAIFLIFALAQLIAGYERHTIFLIDVFVNTLTLFGVYFACRWASSGRPAALFGTAFWAVLSGAMELNNTEVNAEIFINACNVWAFALLLRWKGGGYARPLAIGAVLALATFLKPFVIVAAVIFALVHVCFPPVSSRRADALRDVGLMAVPGLLGWTMHLVYFAAVGRLQPFWESVVVYNRSYAGDLFSNLIAPLRKEAEMLPDLLAPLALLTAAAFVMLWLRSRRREAALLASFVLISWLEIALPGRFFTHYYQLWMPAPVVGAAIFLGLSARETGRLKYAPHAVGALTILLLIAPQLSWYRMALAKDWAGIFSAQRVLPERASANIAAEVTARELDRLLLPDETFYEWGSEPSLYFWSKRRPPAGVLTENHLLAGPLSRQLSAHVAATIERERPEIMVVAEWAASLPGAGENPVFKLLNSHYRPLETSVDKTYSLFVRRGGALEERMRLGVVAAGESQ